MLKTWKRTETLAYWYSSESTQRELCNEYQYDRVLLVCYQNLCVLVLWTKVASALEGLIWRGSNFLTAVSDYNIVKLRPHQGMSQSLSLALTDHVL